MATYQSGTMTLMEQMDHTKLEFDEMITLENNKKVKHIVLKGEDLERILPNKRDLANQALKGPGCSNKEMSMEEKKELAERIGKNWTLLYHVVNDDKPNEATRDMILCAVLLRDEVPCAEEASHVLLRMQREDLYLYTSDKSENCRNLLIRLCLDYANEKNPCPTVDWLVFTNSVICWFNKQMGRQMGIQMKALDAWDPDFSFMDSIAPLLEQWKRKLEKVRFCYLKDYRNALIEAYLAKNDQARNRAGVQDKISQQVGYDASYPRSVFGGNAKKAGSREMLVQSAIQLGCSLKETNLLLRQAARAPLYPYRGVGDAQDAKDIKVLRQNAGLLDPQQLEKFLTEGAIEDDA